MEMRMTEAVAAETNSTARMQFSESMTKTKNAAASSKCCGGGGGRSCIFFFFCCIQSTTDDNEDRYAQEILATEIETLKRTIKEKDLTIRELTDRLYIGTEKFQQYLTTKTKRFDELIWPQPRVINQHRCNETCHEHPTTPPHCHHPPGEECPSSHVADCRCRSIGCSATATRVNDPRQRIQAIAPRGPLDDRREELRNYRLSRYYREEDEEEDDDYDSRSYSDASCSTCAAADLLEMQIRDVELLRRRTQAADDGDGPRELSAANLSLSYAEMQSYAHRGGAGVGGAGVGAGGGAGGRGAGGGGVGGVVPTVHRPTPSTGVSMPLHRRHPPGSPSFQSRSFRPVDERIPPSSAQDSAFDNSTPSSTESATAELVNSSRRPLRPRPPPNRTMRGEEEQRTVEVRSHGAGHMDRQIVGDFSVHRPPAGDDSVTANISHLEGIKMANNSTVNPTATLTPSATMSGGLSSSSTDHQTQMTFAKNGQHHAPPSNVTNHGLHGTVSSNQQHNISSIEQLNPSTIFVQLQAADPMTSNVSSRNESSLQPNESSLQPNESSLQPNESQLQPNESSLQPVSGDALKSNDADSYTMQLTTTDHSRYEINSSDGRLHSGIRTFGLMSVTQI